MGTTLRKALVVAALVMGSMVLASSPARAGDDEECYNTKVGLWTVYYDNACTQEIYQTYSSGKHGIGVSFKFLSDTAPGPYALEIFDPTSYAGVQQEGASGMELWVAGQFIERSSLVYGFSFSETATRDAFRALRAGQPVTVKVSYNSGPQSFLIYGTDLEAAHEQLKK